MVMREQDIVKLISGDVWMMHVLRIVKSLVLPDWCVCAGFVRSKVWDHLHGFHYPSLLSDVDVAYFDASNTSEAVEKEYEKILCGLDASVPWSVKNQARMHLKGGNEPYVSTTDGLSKFPEVCTAIGVYLDSSDEVRLVTPYGIYDLVNMIVRPTPHYISNDRSRIYLQRLTTKRWDLTWNRLKVIRY